MQTPSILTICVNYHNDEETEQFLQDLLIQKGFFEQKVIVVDNTQASSLDSPLRKFAKRDQRIWLITPKQNLGYYGGAAFGLWNYSKTFLLPTWIIVCNVDIEFPESDFLSRLCSFHSESPHAIIAPAITSGNSLANQNPNMKVRPNPLRIHFYKWIFSYSPIAMAYQILSLLKSRILSISNRALLSSAKLNHMHHGSPRLIYAPHGSFIIFNRRYFELGGTLNHGAFLFGEELFVAETARSLGLTILYDPRLQVKHREHSTTSIFKSKSIRQFVKEAARYSADVFFSSSR